MSTPDSLLQEQELLGGLKANNQLAFSKLYDQYAALLLGVITKIVSDKAEALELLETAFTTIRLQIDQFRPDKQSLFLWLLQMARGVALEAQKERRQLKGAVLQLTDSGKVLAPVGQTPGFAPSEPVSLKFIDFQSKALLDSILFKNCTPEEAASSLGIPVEQARQHLRLALQQLRTTFRP